MWFERWLYQRSQNSQTNETDGIIIEIVDEILIEIAERASQTKEWGIIRIRLRKILVLWRGLR